MFRFKVLLGLGAITLGANTYAEYNLDGLCPSGYAPTIKLHPVTHYDKRSDYYYNLSKNAEIQCIIIGAPSEDDVIMAASEKFTNKNKNLNTKEKKNYIVSVRKVIIWEIILIFNHPISIILKRIKEANIKLIPLCMFMHIKTHTFLHNFMYIFSILSFIRNTQQLAYKK